ncbi:hypothetical protein AB0F81_16680 [Actinoplanes sp. NPDC024001]|uniref:hypothetical protein n=1 Tax=Actinoplanes sp. NPDC024001 TaxID=3154598 RepID=UPI00340B3444
MRTSIWLMGARGSVATAGVVGALALRAGPAAPTARQRVTATQVKDLLLELAALRPAGAQP